MLSKLINEASVHALIDTKCTSSHYISLYSFNLTMKKLLSLHIIPGDIKLKYRKHFFLKINILLSDLYF